MASFIIEREDTSHLENGSKHDCEHYVFYGESDFHPETGKYQRRLLFSGSRAACEAFIARNQRVSA